MRVRGLCDGSDAMYLRRWAAAHEHSHETQYYSWPFGTIAFATRRESGIVGAHRRVDAARPGVVRGGTHSLPRGCGVRLSEIQRRLVVRRASSRFAVLSALGKALRLS